MIADSMTETDKMMLNVLVEELAQEPAISDPAEVPYSRTTEEWRRHERWEGKVEALRLLLGIRLVHQALYERNGHG